MAHFEEIKIDRHDGWKYSNTAGTNGDDYYAKVLVNDDGSIAEESYSKAYREKIGKGKETGSIKQSSTKVKSGDGCLMKLIKAPFKCLWWLIVNVLKVVGIGFFLEWLTKDKK